MYSSGIEDAADDHDGDSEHMISGSSQPDHEDHHIMLDTSAEDAFERPSKNAGDSVIPGSPHQPLLAVFPKRTFGQQQRSFCQFWYSKYSWLHYVESTDTVFCYFCMVAEKLKLPISKNKDLAFSVNGFCNWKNATSKFEKHQASVSHRQSIDALDTRETTKDVGELIHAGLSKKKAESRQALMAIISSACYLARHGLALRGRYKKTEEREDDLGEIDSNFIQLLKLRANDIPVLGLGCLNHKINLQVPRSRMNFSVLWP